MKKIILGFMLCSFGGASLAEKAMNITAEDMNFVRIHTSAHSHQPVKQTALVNIKVLGSDCPEGVFLDVETDQASLSMIMTAYVSKLPVRVGYEPTIKAPWGDTRYCQLTYFDLQ